MVRPDLQGFRALARGAAAVPIVREVLADLDTPLATFLKVDDGVSSFLFESVEGGERWGRYSFIGLGARATFVARGPQVSIDRGGRREVRRLAPGHAEDPLDHLRTLLRELRPAELPDLPRFAGGAVGYVGYDWVRYVERLPERNPDPLGLPEAYFTVPEVLLVHDRVRQRLGIIVTPEIERHGGVDTAYRAGLERIEEVQELLARPARPEPAPSVDPGPVTARAHVSRERYLEIVKRAKEYIQAGDIFQVVPSQRFTLPLRTDPFLIYRWLRAINPSPYLFFLRAGDHTLVGSSPEVLVRLDGRLVEVRPIAGTSPRGEDEAEDARIEDALQRDPKELAEHVMLVDLGRNDVGRVAEIGSVEVNEFQVVERYSHVMHLVSNVRGRLRADRDAVDLLRATFPAGTLTGAPKVRAMEIIEELEPVRRGVYGGSVGYLDFRGNMDMCIAIRMLVVRGDEIHVQAGGGIVADSDPEREYEETLHKARALMKAVELAGGGRVA